MIRLRKTLLLGSCLVLLFPAYGQDLEVAPITAVNSGYDELNPVVSPDGNTLYFTRGNDPRNIGGIRDPGDIWFSVRTGEDEWSAPVHGGPQLNDRTYNAVAGFSSDGSELYIMNHFDPSGAPARTQGIAITRSQSSGWSRPENVYIPYFRNQSPFISGFISPDGDVFVYSADTYGTLGVEDIFVSVKDSEGRWTEPRNLGSTINTPFQELSPSLSEDGNILYFSSNGRKGNGSFDVYYSKRLDDTWQNWSQPVNMGRVINTPGRDLYFRDYTNLGFALFTTTENSDGYGDIKMCRNREALPDSAIVYASRSDTLRLSPNNYESNTAHVVAVTGKVYDAETGQAITAALHFSEGDHTVDVAASEDGYTAELSSLGAYDVRIEREGYISDLEKLNLSTLEMSRLDVDFRLQPVKKGTTVTLRNVLFEQGRTTLLEESYPELDVVVEFMKSNPTVEIELSGHTDNRGSQSLNQKLSEDRVEKVKDYLVSKGIASKRISGRGYGGSRPVASNDTEESRRLNRRVEFTIKKF